MKGEELRRGKSGDFREYASRLLALLGNRLPDEVAPEGEKPYGPTPENPESNNGTEE